MSDAWTDEARQEVIEMYKAANPTPENTMDIVERIAKEVDKTPNRVRVLLSKAGEYVTKEKKKADPKATDGAKRVSKQDSIDALNAKIEELGGEVDSSVTEKLTGKAAIYLLNLLNTVAG